MYIFKQSVLINRFNQGLIHTDFVFLILFIFIVHYLNFSNILKWNRNDDIGKFTAGITKVKDILLAPAAGVILRRGHQCIPAMLEHILFISNSFVCMNIKHILGKSNFVNFLFLLNQLTVQPAVTFRLIRRDFDVNDWKNCVCGARQGIQILRCSLIHGTKRPNLFVLEQK